MHRFPCRLVVLVALAIAAGGCGGSSDTTATTPAPATTSVIDTFTGTLTLHGAATYSFTVVAVGTINVQLTSLLPDSAMPVGLSIGTWNGSICTVPPGTFNDQSIQGSVVVGQTQTVGDFCVRIYDAAGTVTTPETYVIEVSHQ
jgi:hypothetical protein